MTQYIEDLVQNIYTNCDKKGLDKLNQGLQDAIWYSAELEKNLVDLNRVQKGGLDFQAKANNQQKQYYLSRKQEENLLYLQTKHRRSLAEQQMRWDEARQHRQDKYNKSLNMQQKIMQKITHFFLGYLSLKTLQNIFNTGSRLQLVQKSIEGLTKSTQDWDYIQQQAFKTGTDIEVVAKGYRNFFSSARMAGFGSGNIQDMYGDVLLATRAIGASTIQTEGALLALEQMLSKGTVSMEELRRQLGNAIPGAFEIGAKAMNMTTQEFNKFVKTGQLASNVFVPRFIAQLKKEYAGGFKEISQTLDFATKNIVNSWKMFTSDLISGETGKGLASILNAFTQILNSAGFRTIVGTLGQILGLVFKITSILIHFMPFILGYAGLKGLVKILPQIAGWLAIIQGEVLTIFSYGVVEGIRYMTKALWGLLAPIMAIVAEFSILMGLILIVQSLWTTLRHPTYDTFVKRLGGYSPKDNDKFEEEILMKNPKYRKTKRLGEYYYNNPQELDYVLPRQNLINPSSNYMPYSPMNPLDLSSYGYGGMYQQDQTISNNVTIGDIQIISNSNNPQEVAQEVQNQLVALFMGQGLMTNVGETVVG